MRQSPRRRSRTTSLSASLLLASLPGLLSCGGGGGGTTAAPTPRPRASSLDFVITPMVGGGTTVAFQWTGSDASAYTVEIGSSSAGSDVARLDAGAATSFSWSGVPVGTFYARVVPRQGTTVGTASNEVIVGSIDARQMIDALIFGSGPLAVAGNAAGPLQADRMEGWQPGSTLRVTIGESAPSYVTTAVEKTVAQVGPATVGTVQAIVYGRAPDPLPSPAPGDVTVSMLSAADVKDQCICTNCVGCAWQWLRGSVVTRGRILISTDAQHSAAAHELGHIVGLAHIISAAGVRPAFTMGFTTDGKYSPDAQLDVLDPATVRMLATLYGMGLTAGSSRTQFEAAGLVPAGAASASSRAEAGRTDPRHVVRTEGLETVVLKPLCR
jgi:hypothetical protein